MATPGANSSHTLIALSPNHAGRTALPVGIGSPFGNGLCPGFPAKIFNFVGFLGLPPILSCSYVGLMVNCVYCGLTGHIGESCVSATFVVKGLTAVYKPSPPSMLPDVTLCYVDVACIKAVESPLSLGFGSFEVSIGVTVTAQTFVVLEYVVVPVTVFVVDLGSGLLMAVRAYGLVTSDHSSNGFPSA